MAPERPLVKYTAANAVSLGSLRGKYSAITALLVLSQQQRAAPCSKKYITMHGHVDSLLSVSTNGARPEEQKHSAPIIMTYHFPLPELHLDRDANGKDNNAAQRVLEAVNSPIYPSPI